MIARLTAAAAVLAALSAPASAADEIRIGYINAITGVFANLAEEMTRGFDLAMEHLGGKVGGMPTKVFKVDDKASPDVAVTEMARLVDGDHVQFVTGILLSNVFNAIGKPLNDRGVFVISGNAGSSYYSGEHCLPNVFAAAFHNDSVNEATAEYMNRKGIKTMVTIGLNYQAGRDQIGGAVRRFKGKVLAQFFPDIQSIDFSSEIAQIRALKPQAVYLFLPGRTGVAFLRQFIQAGLDKKVRVFGGSFHADELGFKALGSFATRAKLELGTFGWSYDFSHPEMHYPFDNPQNHAFVAAYMKKYGRRPTFFAAHMYDTVMLIDSAVRAVKGNVEDRDAVRAALVKADFKSLKGKFKFNNNHYPIQDHYIVTVVKDKDGHPMHKVLGVADKDHEDPYHQQCPMH